MNLALGSLLSLFIQQRKDSVQGRLFAKSFGSTTFDRCVTPMSQVSTSVRRAESREISSVNKAERPRHEESAG